MTADTLAMMERLALGTIKARAGAAVRAAIRSGALVRSLCAAPPARGGCAGRIEAHHASYEYERWLDVVWLCHRHHAEVHVDLRALGKTFAVSDATLLRVLPIMGSVLIEARAEAA